MDEKRLAHANYYLDAIEFQLPATFEPCSQSIDLKYDNRPIFVSVYNQRVVVVPFALRVYLNDQDLTKLVGLAARAIGKCPTVYSTSQKTLVPR